jgi:O-succinylhomoserine sulfhydrylase
MERCEQVSHVQLECPFMSADPTQVVELPVAVAVAGAAAAPRVVISEAIAQARPSRDRQRAPEPHLADSHETAPPGFMTVAIRTGHWRTMEGEHCEPIFETSSYVYADSAQSEATFAGTIPGNVYSRFTNPTVAVFERRLAALELAESGVGTASGMAALLALCMTFLRSGDHVICSRAVFGSTTILLRDFFVKFGVELSFVPAADNAAWQAAVRPQTRLFFCETPANPTLEIADIRSLADMAHDVGAILVIDNTFCTPCGQTPIALGADLVLHSASKYIDGQGRCIGGAVVGSSTLITRLRGFMRCAGPALAAHSAWMLLKGLETLQLRMERHSQNAQTVAEWLHGHPRVRAVLYTGLRDHPQYALACRQQRFHGGVLSFLLEGDKAAAWRCIDAMRMISRTTNIGDSKSMVTHPASTTHLRVPPVERQRNGVHDNLIRVSIGLENVQDIITDLDRGLLAV